MRAGAAERPNGHHRGVSTSPFVIYFAYGSNMLWQRIRARVPSARPLGGAILHGHRLAWHKSGRDGSGKCDVVPIAEAGHAVHGVLYEILAAEKPALDLAEGLGVDYDEKQVEVETRTGPVTAWVYLAMRTRPDRAAVRLVQGDRAGRRARARFAGRLHRAARCCAPDR